MNLSIRRARSPGGLTFSATGGSNAAKPAVSARIRFWSHVRAGPVSLSFTFSAVMASVHPPARRDISTWETNSVTVIRSSTGSPENSNNFTDLSFAAAMLIDFVCLFLFRCLYQGRLYSPYNDITHLFKK